MLLTLSGSSARKAAGSRRSARRDPAPAGCAPAGSCRPGASRSTAVAALELQVTVADQVQVADGRGRRLIQRQRAGPRRSPPVPAVPPSISVTLETLPTSTPDARTNWPARSPLALVNTAEYPVVRSNRIWPNTTMMIAVKTNSTSEKMPSLIGGAGDFHGLIVFSPIWRPQTYSMAHRLADFEVVVRRERWRRCPSPDTAPATDRGVMSCQQPGAPAGSAARVHPRQVVRVDVRVGRPEDRLRRRQRIAVAAGRIARSWARRRGSCGSCRTVRGCTCRAAAAVGTRSAAPRARYGPPRSKMSSPVLPNPTAASNAASSSLCCLLSGCAPWSPRSAESSTNPARRRRRRRPGPPAAARRSGSAASVDSAAPESRCR